MDFDIDRTAQCMSQRKYQAGNYWVNNDYLLILIYIESSIEERDLPPPSIS